MNVTLDAATLPNMTLVFGSKLAPVIMIGMPPVDGAAVGGERPDAGRLALRQLLNLRQPGTGDLLDGRVLRLHLLSEVNLSGGEGAEQSRIYLVEGAGQVVLELVVGRAAGAAREQRLPGGVVKSRERRCRQSARLD